MMPLQQILQSLEKEYWSKKVSQDMIHRKLLMTAITVHGKEDWMCGHTESGCITKLCTEKFSTTMLKRGHNGQSSTTT